MESEEEIRALIKNTEKNFEHVLKLKGANVVINAPRALMQHEATTKISAWYLALGEKRPKYPCDDFE